MRGRGITMMAGPDKSPHTLGKRGVVERDGKDSAACGCMRTQKIPQMNSAICILVTFCPCCNIMRRSNNMIWTKILKGSHQYSDADLNFSYANDLQISTHSLPQHSLLGKY